METVSVWEDRKVLEVCADVGSALIHATEPPFRWCRGFLMWSMSLTTFNRVTYALFIFSLQALPAFTALLVR